MFVFLQNPHVEILNPKVMVLGSGVFGSTMLLRHEGGTFKNGITAHIIRETPVFSCSSACEGTEEMAIYEPESADTLTLDSSDSQTVRNKLLFL